jgi:hypothetical protein
MLPLCNFQLIEKLGRARMVSSESILPALTAGKTVTLDNIVNLLTLEQMCRMTWWTRSKLCVNLMLLTAMPSFSVR